MKFGRFICVVFAASIFLSFSLMPLGASADGDDTIPDWLSGNPVYNEVPTPNGLLKCHMETRLIKPIFPRVYALDGDFHGYIQDVCVYKSKGYQYARFQRDYYLDASMQTTFPEKGVAFSIDDGAMTPSQSLGNENSVEQLYAGSERTEFIDTFSNNQRGDGIRIYRDVPSMIKETPIGSELQVPITPEFLLANEGGAPISIKGTSVSNNGRWATFVIANTGFIRLDLNDFNVLRISDNFPFSYPEPTVETSISDDGKVAVMGGYYAPFEVIIVNGSCGRLNDIYTDNARLLLGQDACPKKDLWAFVNEYSPKHHGYRWLKLDASGKSFTYFDHIKWATISAPAPRLEYLAMGDSFASGEGDVSGSFSDHYLPGTNIYGDYGNNIPREVCHVSSRSYPMLLAKNMNLHQGLNMQSVACSGAVIGDIYSSDSGNEYVDGGYLGQSTRLPSILGEEVGPRLTGIEGVDLLKSDALVSAIPGRVQQIEFVKNTRPKIITIMAGGNDLGFGDVMSSCLINFDKKRLFTEDCYYASPHGRTILADRISNMYQEFVNLYRVIKVASPDSTIYVVGYPQFMDMDSASCYEYANLYTRNERIMVGDAINYANAVIRSAAMNAGVYYIDIANALLGEGHCASGTGMTGVGDLLLNGLYTEAMKGLDSEKRYLLNGGLLGGSTANDLFLRTYYARRAELAARAVAYGPRTIYQQVTQQLLHPNASGHSAIYQEISSGLDDGSLRSPSCNLTIICPTGEDRVPRATDYIKKLIAANVRVDYGASIAAVDPRILSDSQTIPVISKGDEVVIRYKDDSDLLIEGELMVELHSSPQYLGKMSRLSDGVYELRTVISGHIPAGTHVIHITGHAADGRPVDIAQELFVEGYSNDIDDDGIVNRDDACAFILPSQMDADYDGIADNCDLDVLGAADEILTPAPVGLMPDALSLQRAPNTLTLTQTEDKSYGTEDAKGWLDASSAELNVLGESQDLNYTTSSGNHHRSPVGIFMSVVAIVVLILGAWKQYIKR